MHYLINCAKIENFLNFHVKINQYGKASSTNCFLHFTISGSGSLRDFHQPESSDNRFDCNNWSVSDTVHLCFHNGKGTRHIECLRNHHFIHHTSSVYLIVSKSAGFTSGSVGWRFSRADGNCFWNSCSLCNFQAELC